jgi:hypothetical protein
VKIGRRSFVQAEELDQHVLQAVSNVILEVSACRNNVSDQAEAIASSWLWLGVHQLSLNSVKADNDGH